MPSLSIQSVLVAALAFLPSCIIVKPEQAPLRTAQEVHDNSTVEYDRYKKSAWLRGPTIDLQRLTAFHMRSLWSEGSQGVIQLYISDKALSWRYFQNANDRDGNSLPLTAIGTDVESAAVGRLTGTWCYEDVAVQLTKEYLESHATSGISVKVWGRGGECVVDVPPFYVDGFLRRLGEHAATMAAASAPKEVANQ